MRIIVITGASDGIGAEIARQLAASHKSGIGFVLAARKLDALQAVAAQCEAQGAKTLCVRTDVGVREDCAALIAQTVAQFGRIDALINNAGISAQALLAEVPADKLGWYEDVMRVNLWGSVWCTHAALPQLIAAKGSIVPVSSLAGLIGVPGRTAYSASKFAQTGFFEALRRDESPWRERDHGLSRRSANADSPAWLECARRSAWKQRAKRRRRDDGARVCAPYYRRDEPP
jgi:NAD(P)-dependent dehydrogenase (short-subunit alcohol dehydrogenase family)